MNNLDAIYVDVDDFCLLFEPQWLKHLIESGEKQRIKPSRLSSSEVMTILIAFINQVIAILKLTTPNLFVSIGDIIFLI